MDNWQAWAAGIFGLMMSTISFNSRRERLKADAQVAEYHKYKLEIMERITRVEAEIMTEREVREILQEFFHPFLLSLNKIESKTDHISSDITELKIKLAQRRKGDE